jgi:hypothetical protein
MNKSVRFQGLGEAARFGVIIIIASSVWGALYGWPVALLHAGAATCAAAIVGYKDLVGEVESGKSTSGKRRFNLAGTRALSGLFAAR